MTLPDYRIRFPSTKIDFDDDVHGGSVDGQDINDFPSPGQARYDWMRMVVIGLLANQSSTEEPINYKIGTIWHNLNDLFYKYFNGEDFVELANGIRIGETTLENWSQIVDETVGKVTESSSFSGISEANNITEIDVPEESSESAAYSNNHPILFVDGLLIDPRLTAFSLDKTKILLLDNEAGSIKLMKNDKYTIVIQRLDTIVPETVIVS